MEDLIEAEVVTETVDPASAAVAVLDHTRPWSPSTFAAWTSVQPAGAAPNVAVEELTVRNASSVSPACTPPGTTTECVARPLLLVLAASTYPTLAAAALTDLVTVPVPPSLSVTVRVTSRV